jgi:hypothetical protein
MAALPVAPAAAVVPAAVVAPAAAAPLVWASAATLGPPTVAPVATSRMVAVRKIRTRVTLASTAATPAPPPITE